MILLPTTARQIEKAMSHLPQTSNEREQKYVELAQLQKVQEACGAVCTVPRTIALSSS